MSAPYFICGLPRTRTAWLATLLTWESSFCFHEALVQCKKVSELHGLFGAIRSHARYVGDADPSIGLVAAEVFHEFPKARYVFIHRPLEDSIEAEYAAMEEDWHPAFDGVTKDQIALRVKSAQAGLDDLWKTVPIERKMFAAYKDLDREAVVRGIWYFCVPTLEFPEQRYWMIDNFRITQIFRKVIGKHRSHEGILERQTTLAH